MALTRLRAKTKTGHRGCVHMGKLTPARVSYRDDFLKHHACATRSSLPADRFHTGMGGRFAFT